jgi:ATP-dependent Clp protease protease subunit
MWSRIVMTVGVGMLLACGNSKRPDPVAELLAQRIVELRGEIDDRTATELIAKLLYLQHQDPAAPIRLHIDSHGGAVAAGLAIRDTMDDIKPPVYTHCPAKAQGVAVVLLAHGERGHRTAATQATISFTPIAPGPNSPTGATAQSDIARTETLIADALAKDTGQRIEQIQDDHAAQRRFDAEQARSYGLIDRIAD